MFYALCQRIIEVVSNFPSSIELHLPWIFLILHLWMVVHPYILNIALPLMFSICASSLMITGCFQNLLLRLICDLYYHHVRCQQTRSLTYTFDPFFLTIRQKKEKRKWLNKFEQQRNFHRTCSWATCLLLPPFQNVGRFDFSRLIDFVIHLDIHYI